MPITDHSTWSMDSKSCDVNMLVHCVLWHISPLISTCHQHGYPWPSLATPAYCLSLPAGPQGYTSYPHKATVCSCELVAPSLLGHVKRFIGVHHLWVRPYFSSSPACLGRLTWIVFVMGGRWPYSYCFVGCCLQDLFSIARSILV